MFGTCLSMYTSRDADHVHHPLHISQTLFDGGAKPARPLEYEEDDNKAVDAAAKPA